MTCCRDRIGGVLYSEFFFNNVSFLSLFWAERSWSKHDIHRWIQFDKFFTLFTLKNQTQLRSADKTNSSRIEHFNFI